MYNRCTMCCQTYWYRYVIAELWQLKNRHRSCPGAWVLSWPLHFTPLQQGSTTSYRDVLAFKHGDMDAARKSSKLLLTSLSANQLILPDTRLTTLGKCGTKIWSTWNAVFRWGCIFYDWYRVTWGKTSTQRSQAHILITNVWNKYTSNSWYGSGHETAAVLLPGFAINW